MRIFYILIFLLFLSIGTYLGYRYYKDTILIKTTDFVDNNEFKNKKDLGRADVLLLYTDWCPHCKDTIKTWNILKQVEIDPNLKLNFIKVDCEKEKNMASKYNIKEYPTIILEKDDKKIVFDANLTEKSFIKFVKAVNHM